MAATRQKRRGRQISVVPGPEVERLFGWGTSVYNDVLQRAAQCVGLAWKDNEGLFSNEEWKYLAAMLREADIPPYSFLPGELLATWLCSEEKTRCPDGSPFPGIVSALRRMDYVHAWACWQCVRRAWQWDGTISAGDEWWKLGFRPGERPQPGPAAETAPLPHPPLPDFQKTLLRAQAEVKRDVNLGRVPADVPNAAALHQFVDANYYGGAFDHFGHGEAALEDHAAFWNKIHDALDAWISAGVMMRELRITFEEFQATRAWHDDLGPAVKDDALNGVKGYTYLGDNLFVESTEGRKDVPPGVALGRWYTCIGRTEYDSDDLEEVERPVYEFAVREGYCG